VLYKGINKYTRARARATRTHTHTHARARTPTHKIKTRYICIGYSHINNAIKIYDTVNIL